jgi:hypothetical protein
MPSTSFQRRWAITRTLGSMIGYLSYTPIRHGLTGSHGRQLTLSQLRPPTSLEQPPQENGELGVDQSSLLLAALMWAGGFPRHSRDGLVVCRVPTDLSDRPSDVRIFKPFHVRRPI